MDITFFRSSSFGQWEFCPQSYFFNYILGREGKLYKATIKGTIVHKVLEIIAKIKQADQLNNKAIEDNIVGIIIVHCHEVVVEIIQKVYDFYIKKYNYHAWDSVDLKDCIQWVQTVLDDQQFSPLNRDIIQPELSFDFEIQQPWAVYDGDKFLRLKGTIDLVTQISPKVYEVIDWKTGQRKNWNTGEKKDQNYFLSKEDFQLRLYHYAVHKTYPFLDQVIMTIFYIRDGGPFPVGFSKDDFNRTEEMIEERFNEIKNTSLPVLNKSWKCHRLCNFGKNSFENPLFNSRYKRNMTQCEQVEFELRSKGIGQTIENYRTKGFCISEYGGLD